MERRIRELRKTLKITQGAMADKLRVTANYIYLLENGKTPITDKIVLLICDTFDVNEEWLRDGTGDMFKPMDRTQEVARITKKLLTAPDDDFLYRVIRVLSNLTDEQIKTLKDIGEQFLNDQN